MPNCYQLFPVGEDQPAILQRVDDRLWREVGDCQPDPSKWYKNWHNIIGLALACGKSLDEIRDILKEQLKMATGEAEVDDYVKLIEVTDFLKEHYTTTAFYQPR